MSTDRGDVDPRGSRCPRPARRSPGARVPAGSTGVVLDRGVVDEGLGAHPEPVGHGDRERARDEVAGGRLDRWLGGRRRGEARRRGGGAAGRRGDAARRGPRPTTAGEAGLALGVTRAVAGRDEGGDHAATVASRAAATTAAGTNEWEHRMRATFEARGRRIVARRGWSADAAAGRCRLL